MAVIDVTPQEKSTPTIEAVLQTSVPESALKVGGVYLTGTVYGKELVYKGKTYAPTRLQLITVRAGSLTFATAPANYVFTVGNKTFKINADRSQILIIAGGEPILWRLIKSIQSSDPTNTSSTFLPEAQGIITNGIASTRFSYFYTYNEIYQSEPLQDGVIFRYIEPGSGAITWRKFAIAGEGGIFEEFGAVPNAAIASVKNIDFANLQDLDQIVAALDTVDGKPFSAAIFGNAGQQRLELNILVNGQNDQRQNGLYYFSCIQGVPEACSAVRISPYLQNTIAYIGRARCLVWQGDRFGQDEAWLRSDAPIGATSSQPRVSVGNGVHNWTKNKPTLSLEQQLASTMEKMEQVEQEAETDPVAITALNTAKSELTAAIGLKADDADLTAAVTDINAKFAAVDLTKADKTSIDNANKAIADLTTALARNDATDAELDAAINAANEAISAITATKTNHRVLYTQNAVIPAHSGDDITVSLEGDIQLPLTPKDGDEVKIFDPSGLIKSGKNNVLPGPSDTIGIAQSVVTPNASTALSWATNNPLSEGFVLLKYQATAKNWHVFFMLSGGVASSERVEPADQTYQPGSKSTAPISHAAISAIVDKAIADLKKLQTIESSNLPNLDDPNWAIWIQRVYDYSVPSGTARAWLRTPNTNDEIPFPNSWTEAVTMPTLAAATQDPSRTDLLVLELPQGVRFRFPTTVPLNSSLSCDISFPAGIFTGISYQLADENKSIIPKTPRGQQVTDTDRAAGIGWASVPSNAKFAQFNFAYKNGGNLPFEFPITIS
jgi:hypothetical protein